MHYAQFYNQTPKGLLEACGDRAVIILDGRESQWKQEHTAKQECAKRGYVAFRLYKGESFTRSWPISQITILPG